MMAKKIIDLARPLTRIENASSPFDEGRDRYAVLVHFSISPVLTRSVVTLVAELHANGYFVVISSACESPLDLEWPGGAMPDATIVIRKPNIGYDFGTAAVALDLFPLIAGAPYVLVVNDSNVGPLTSLAPIISDFENSEADAWALTGSNQHGFHLQSFFLGFRSRILLDRPLREFWRNIRHFEDKRKVILHYELGLSRLLFEEGYIVDVAFPHTAFDNASTANLSANLWLDLLNEGYPFIKREMAQKPWIERTAIRIPAVAKYFFREDVKTWL